MTTPAPRLTLDQIAAAAAALITQARTAGLTAPFALHCHDYNPPGATLHLSEHDTPDIWNALNRWAARYGTRITTHPGTAGSTHAHAKFRRDGITYEITAVISDPPASPPAKAA